MAEGNVFSKRMYARAERVEKNISITMRRVALAVDQAVVLATPVDEGRARANWVVGIDDPNRALVDDFPMGEEGSSGAAAAADSIARAAAVIAQYGVDSREIYISNNLPYIKRLNEGWSAQAPAGFVEEAAQAAAKAVLGSRLLEEPKR